MRTANKSPTGTEIEIKWTVEQFMHQSIVETKRAISQELVEAVWLM